MRFNRPVRWQFCRRFVGVSGMSRNIFCQVLNAEISEKEIFQRVRSDEHGGVNVFFGAVRDFNAGKKVVAVSYDSYEPLAEKIFHEIAEEACARWGSSLRICVVHRVGRLKCGEISVGIGVSSRHRDESYQASRYIIEEIKHRAPIWKKEFYENGETEWLRGHALCAQAGEHAHHERAGSERGSK